MKKTIYLMRHGETLFNELKRIQGWCDSPLTKKGIKQALSIKDYFKSNNIKIDHAYCSTSERCSDTLELVTALPYKRMKGLKEMYFGKFEGQSEVLNPPKEKYESFFTDFGGESREDVRNRIYKALKEIALDDNEVSLVVSHGGASFHFLTMVESIDKFEEIKNKGIGNCTVFKYTYEDDKFKLEDIINPSI